MDPPRGRKGALGDQKGPRIEEEVGMSPVSVMCLCAISSTSLMEYKHLQDGLHLKRENLRFETDNVGDTLAFVSDGSADLTD